MSGQPWEVFDAVGSDPSPTSRALNNTDGRYDWPDAELTNGIAAISIMCHGDQPDGGFLKVVGTGEATVQAVFERARDLILAGALTPLFGERS